MVTLNTEVPLPKLKANEAAEVVELVAMMTSPAGAVETRYAQVVWWLLSEVKRLKKSK